MELLPFDPIKGDAVTRKKHIAEYLQEINDYIDRKQKNIDITDMASALADIFKKKIGISEAFGRKLVNGESTGGGKYNYCKFKLSTKQVPYITNLWDEDEQQYVEMSYTLRQLTVKTPWGACVMGNVTGLRNPVWDCINTYTKEMIAAQRDRINRFSISAAKKQALQDALTEDFVDGDGNPIDVTDVDIDWAMRNMFHLVTEDDTDNYNDYDAYFWEPFTPTNSMWQEWWKPYLNIYESFPTYAALISSDSLYAENYYGAPFRSIFQIPLDATIKPPSGSRVYTHTIIHNSAELQFGPLSDYTPRDWQYFCALLTIPIEGANENLITYEDEEDEWGELNYDYLSTMQYARIYVYDEQGERVGLDFKIKKTTSPNVIANLAAHDWTPSDDAIEEVFDEDTDERTAIRLFIDSNTQMDFSEYYRSLEEEMPASISVELWGHIEHPGPPPQIVAIDDSVKRDVSLATMRGMWSEYNDFYEREQYWSKTMDEAYYPGYHPAYETDMNSIEVHFLPVIDVEIVVDEDHPDADPEYIVTKKNPDIDFDFMIMGGEITDVECDGADERFYWDYFEGELDEFLSFWGDKIYPPAIASVENDGFYYPTDDNPVDKTPMEYFHEAAPDRNIAQITAYFQTNGMTFDWFATAAYYYVWSGGHYDPEDNEEFHYSATVLANIKNMILQAYNKNNELYNIFGNLTDD